MCIEHVLVQTDGSFCWFTVFAPLKDADAKVRLDCQNDLSKSITKLNHSSKLFIMREAPQTLFPKLFKAWNITHLVFEKDTDAYARDRDNVVIAAAKEYGVNVIMRCGRTLWDSDELVKKNHSKPTMSITQLQAAGSRIGPIPRPIPAPRSIPDPGELTLKFGQDKPNSLPDFNAKWRSSNDKSFADIAGPNGDFSAPTLEELGFSPATTPHRGGECEALMSIAKIIANEVFTATFEKPKTSPAAFDPQSTTLLSPHLHFGSLGIREFYWRVQDVVMEYKGKASAPPTSLIGQLLFRDMYFAAQAALGHQFSQTIHNTNCRFIPWHLPTEIDKTTNLATASYHIDSVAAEQWFQRWKHGRTGFPWIDALMRQLKQEGWIHHLGRHSVASFLTRGGCYISWERGAAVFEEWLIDHEVACNAGNWQWLSCTAFFAQFYRVYSPVAFPKKWDKEGVFVRKYVPELKDMPSKYIYEPWKAPLETQKVARVVIRGEGSEDEEGVYPTPMFDFDERRIICLDGMKKAYTVGLYGADPQVIDGTWRSLFHDGRGGHDTKAGAGLTDENHTVVQKKEVNRVNDTSGSKRAAAEGPLDRFLKKSKV